MKHLDNWLNKKIMIVDDLAQMRENLHAILLSFGFTNIHEHIDGKAAWEDLKYEAQFGEPYQIIFSDINMPIMNGITLLKTLRKFKTYETTPVFMVSTETEKNVIMKAILAGATDYMIKPYDAELVFKKISERLK